jgi:cytochrome c-type biogenesis protein CcsB
LIYALLLAAATLIEKYISTDAAKTFIYYSPVTILLLIGIVASFIAVVVKRRLWGKYKWSFLFIHGALIVILSGAFVTHIWGEEGIVHIREGQSTNLMLIRTNDGDEFKKLPFNIELKEFILTYYPGSSSPSSFESILIIHENGRSTEKSVSVNNVLDIRGYRFFQSSYDMDKKGTILTVNKDIPGRQIIYMGYFLLIIGFILFLTSKNSRIRQLIRSLSGLTVVLLLFVGCTTAPPAANHRLSHSGHVEFLKENKIDSEQAKKFGALAIQSPDGRIKPVNTFSSEVLRKLHKSDKIWGMNSDQFLLSVLTYPEIWKQMPVIHLSNKHIGTYLEMKIKNDFSYTEFFDSDGNYKLQKKIEEIYYKSPSERSKFEKDLLKLDEQIFLFHQLLHFDMSNILSDTDNRINPNKIKAELLYNKLNIFRLCKMIYLIFGGILLILTVISLFIEYKLIRRIIPILSLFILIGLLYHVFGIGLRWYIAGYAPWSNSYETMVFVSLISVLAGIIFYRQSKIVFALAVLFGGVILFVAGLNWMDPQISSLVPVLKSPWLMFHVAIIMISYGFFGINFLLGLTNLILLKLNKKKTNEIISLRIRELSIINEISLWIGLSFLTVGTFLGAIWANESWGRYWGWDPKETWALITIIAYTAVTHLAFINKKENPRWLNIGSVIAFFCVLMTYFGVNYFLSGMHSY